MTGEFFENMGFYLKNAAQHKLWSENSGHPPFKNITQTTNIVNP